MTAHKQPGLNQPQQEAVEFFEGPALVLAGAGSGKTRVVTLRVVRLLERGVPPSAILGLTFTNKAAEEMRARIMNATQSDVLICTFHSLGARILRQSIFLLGYSRYFTIYDEDDSDKVLKVVVSDLGFALESSEFKNFRTQISLAKNALKEPDDLVSEGNCGMLLPQVYRAYQAKLKEYNALDFDDLLYLTVKLFKEHPEELRHYQERWQFVLIDEYQDTNHCQYELVRLLVERSKNLFVVGDPDQSIYSWRGANLHNILDFEKTFPGATVIRLEQNYRSHTNILSAANALIAANQFRYEKNLWSELGEGEKIRRFTGESDRDEVRFVIDRVRHHHVHDNIPYHQMVIFYRTNFQSRAFEDQLLAQRIPYGIVGGISFYQRREIRDVLAFLRMVQSSYDYVSFERTLNLPKRGIGGVTLEKIRDAASASGLPIFDFCLGLVQSDAKDSVLKLSAKQREGLRGYVNLILALREQAEKGGLKDLVRTVIETTGYIGVLQDDEQTFDDRKANVFELESKAMEWEDTREDASLSAFLEELSLKSSLDEADQSDDKLTLMTLHNGKGLEFKVVFLVGLEEDLCPHINSADDELKIEEERRLCYVGMTRAKELLYLTHSKQRLLWGTVRRMRPSRFLREIPEEYVEKVAQAPSSTYGSSWRPPAPTFIPRSQVNESSSEPIEEEDLVFHREFGIGTVEEVYQGSAGLTYRIFFSNEGEHKNIVAQYANLKRLPRA